MEELPTPFLSKNTAPGTALSYDGWIVTIHESILTGLLIIAMVAVAVIVVNISVVSTLSFISFVVLVYW
jgi:hypothetical protein